MPLAGLFAIKTFAMFAGGALHSDKFQASVPIIHQFTSEPHRLKACMYPQEICLLVPQVTGFVICAKI
jgi:hypothetical protein